MYFGYLFKLLVLRYQICCNYELDVVWTDSANSKDLGYWYWFFILFEGILLLQKVIIITINIIFDGTWDWTQGMHMLGKCSTIWVISQPYHSTL
jgi:hypothetical protein